MTHTELLAMVPKDRIINLGCFGAHPYPFRWNHGVFEADVGEVRCYWKPQRTQYEDWIASFREWVVGTTRQRIHKQPTTPITASAVEAMKNDLYHILWHPNDTQSALSRLKSAEYLC